MVVDFLQRLVSDPATELNVRFVGDNPSSPDTVTDTDTEQEEQQEYE
jgi:hypothetical protein